MTIHSLSVYASSFFQEKIIESFASSLTDQQRRILVIGSAVISCIAMAYTIKRYCFQAKPLPPHPNFPSPHSPKAPSPSSPNVYHWVKGRENAKKFMHSKVDLSIVAKVAKRADSYASPLRDRTSFLYIGDLIDFASTEQIEAIVKGVASDKAKLRAIFSKLFNQLNHKKIYKLFDTSMQKIKMALQALSHSQLMQLLEFDKTRMYQLQRHEIHSIPFEHFLKWQKELDLPKDFLDGCVELKDDYEHVEAEAEKEPWMCIE